MRVQNLITYGLLMIATVSTVSCAAYWYSGLVAYNMMSGTKGNGGALYADTGDGIAKINAEMAKNGDAVTLAKTYQAAYGKNFQDVPANGDTGQAFDNMKTATRYFRNILRNGGIANADDYVLTRLDAPHRKDLELIAVVYRPKRTIRISDSEKSGNRILKVLTPETDAYYRPYRADVYGDPLDVVIEWAAVSTECFKRQGEQAIFLTRAANNMIAQKATGGFWAAAKNFKEGDIHSVLLAGNYMVCHAFSVERRG